MVELQQKVAELERLKEELALEVARLASSLEVREQEVAQFLSVSTEREGKVERVQEQLAECARELGIAARRKWREYAERSRGEVRRRRWHLCKGQLQGGDKEVVKAVGVERENVKTERLLASVGESGSPSWSFLW